MYDFIFFIPLYSFQISIIAMYIYNLEIMEKMKKMTLGSG